MSIYNLPFLVVTLTSLFLSTVTTVASGQQEKNKAKRLPEGCIEGQIAKFTLDSETGDGVWVCANDNNAKADPPCFDNDNRYVDCGNGTVTDTVTGIIWLQDADCLMGTTDWKSANEFASSLADGQCALTDGSTAGDWRLPTKEEWEATIARAEAIGCTFPAQPSLTDRAGTNCFTYDPDPVFSGVQPAYWSSSAFDSFPDLAWVVSLYVGRFTGVFSKDRNNDISVWPVRGGR